MEIPLSKCIGKLGKIEKNYAIEHLSSKTSKPYPKEEMESAAEMHSGVKAGEKELDRDSFE